MGRGGGGAEAAAAVAPGRRRRRDRRRSPRPPPAKKVSHSHSDAPQRELSALAQPWAGWARRLSPSKAPPGPADAPKARRRLSSLFSHLGRLLQPVTGFADADVEDQLGDLDVAHRVGGLVALWR